MTTEVIQETETFKVSRRIYGASEITLPKRPFLVEYADARAAAVIRCSTDSPTTEEIHRYLIRHPKFAAMTHAEMVAKLKSESGS